MIDEQVAKVESLIRANGGEVKELQRWGRRKLAYEIKKRQLGYYVFIKFNAEGPFIERLSKEFRLNESIFRYLTILLERNVAKEG